MEEKANKGPDGHLTTAARNFLMAAVHMAGWIDREFPGWPYAGAKVYLAADIFEGRDSGNPWQADDSPSFINHFAHQLQRAILMEDKIIINRTIFIVLNIEVQLISIV